MYVLKAKLKYLLRSRL